MDTKKTVFQGYEKLVDALDGGTQLLDEYSMCLEDSIGIIGNIVECPSEEEIREMTKKLNALAAIDNFRNFVSPVQTYRLSNYVKPIKNSVITAFGVHATSISNAVRIFQNNIEKYNQKVVPKNELERELRDLKYYIEESDLQGITESDTYKSVIQQRADWERELQKLNQSPEINELEVNYSCIVPFFRLTSALMRHFEKNATVMKDEVEKGSVFGGMNLNERIREEEKRIEDHLESIPDLLSSELLVKFEECNKDRSYHKILTKSERGRSTNIRRAFGIFSKEIIDYTRKFQSSYNLLKRKL
jgi:hypothetical protein